MGIGEVAVIINKKYKTIIQMNNENKDELTPSSGNTANAMLGVVLSYRGFTVKDLVEKLLTFPKDAVICRIELGNPEPFYSSMELVKLEENVDYIDFKGDDVKGNIVAVY